MFYRELPMAAQSAYAEILDQKQSADIRSLTGLPGSFHKRSAKKSKYWYFGYRDIDGHSRMIYIGPDNERVQLLVDRFRNRIDAAKTTLPHVRAAIALGCHQMTNKHFRIIERLAEYGIFRAGGVLVGTHAFNVLGNMLGVRWGDASQTMDVDFAHAGNNISLALPANMSFDRVSAIESLEMGLLPILALSGKAGAQYRNPADPELRIDFLTCQHRKKGPIHVPNSNLVLEPLKFMEYSLEGIAQGCAMSPLGACVVNLPSPERFAIHKLIVFGERPVASRTKANKDLLQAASLFSVLRDTGQAVLLQKAWDDAVARGKGWASRASRGLAAMLVKYPALSHVLRT